MQTTSQLVEAMTDSGTRDFTLWHNRTNNKPNAYYIGMRNTL